MSEDVHRTGVCDFRGERADGVETGQQGGFIDRCVLPKGHEGWHQWAETTTPNADTERQAINYLRDNGQRSTHEVAEFLQMPADRAGVVLGRLARRGAVQKVQRIKGASSWRLP